MTCDYVCVSHVGSSSEPINRARTCGTVRGVLIARATDLSDSPWSANQTTANDHTLSTEDSKPVPLRCLCVSQCGTHLATGKDEPLPRPPTHTSAMLC